jgi:hypothetical protein
MSNNVILTEPSDKRRRVDESNVKRMKYLLKENSQLKEQVKDLKNLIDLNRDALQCMTQLTTPKGKDSRYSEMVKISHQDTYSTAISRDRGNEEMVVDGSLRGSLVNTLIQENKKLAAKLDAVIEERNMAQNRCYLNERIIQQNIEFEEEIVMEYKDKIENLKMNIRTKEYILHEFECLRMIPAEDSEIDSKTYMIFKEIVAPYKLVNTVTNEKKALENELIEERIANSKVRKDYKGLFDKSVVFYLLL